MSDTNEKNKKASKYMIEELWEILQEIHCQKV